ncbi:MAG: DUF4115 domain-containing protein [Deltaproteobacteria bacterium]|nr:DUF4115 domain-containing protein [Deltaproteobacteria bacterium]
MANVEGKGFGAALRTAREAAGREIRDLAEITKIQGRYLVALEAEEWRTVPRGVIGRGFVRVLARELGVPPAELLQLYRAARGDDDVEPHRSLPEVDWKVEVGVGAGAGRKARPLLLASGVVVLVALGLWRWGPWNRPLPPELPPEEAPVSAAPAGPAEPTPVRVAAPPTTALQSRPAPLQPEPAGTAPAAVRPLAGSAATARGGLDVEAVDRVWIRVEPEGGQPQERVLKPGDRAGFGGHGPFRVKVSNGAAVRLFWNGEPLGAPGTSPGVVSLTVPSGAAGAKP